MHTVVLATNNEHKIREITEIMAGLPVKILSKKDFEQFPDVDETGQTLEENAILKAAETYKATGIIAVADDTGLEVDALDGRPGVYSARYAGPGCSFADNNRKLLEEMKDMPEEKRTARFRCVMAICFGLDHVETVEGSVEGLITAEIFGKEGFGYDPVFYHPAYKKTFAQMDPGEKNAVSHRGRAVRKVRDVLIKRLNLEVE